LSVGVELECGGCLFIITPMCRATICSRPSIGVLHVQSSYHLSISEPRAPHHPFVDWN